MRGYALGHVMVIRMIVLRLVRESMVFRSLTPVARHQSQDTQSTLTPHSEHPENSPAP
jgi:hypothetical protein